MHCLHLCIMCFRRGEAAETHELRIVESIYFVEECFMEGASELPERTPQLQVAGCSCRGRGREPIGKGQGT
jgi:hypothetical protein